MLGLRNRNNRQLDQELNQRFGITDSQRLKEYFCQSFGLEATDLEIVNILSAVERDIYQQRRNARPQLASENQAPLFTNDEIALLIIISKRDQAAFFRFVQNDRLNIIKNAPHSIFNNSNFQSSFDEFVSTPQMNQAVENNLQIPQDRFQLNQTLISLRATPHTAMMRFSRRDYFYAVLIGVFLFGILVVLPTILTLGLPNFLTHGFNFQRLHTIFSNFSLFFSIVGFSFIGIAVIAFRKYWKENKRLHEECQAEISRAQRENNQLHIAETKKLSVNKKLQNIQEAQAFFSVPVFSSRQNFLFHLIVLFSLSILIANVAISTGVFYTIGRVFFEVDLYFVMHHLLLPLQHLFPSVYLSPALFVDIGIFLITAIVGWGVIALVKWGMKCYFDRAQSRLQTELSVVQEEIQTLEQARDSARDERASSYAAMNSLGVAGEMKVVPRNDEIELQSLQLPSSSNSASQQMTDAEEKQIPADVHTSLLDDFAETTSSTMNP